MDLRIFLMYHIMLAKLKKKNWWSTDWLKWFTLQYFQNTEKALTDSILMIFLSWWFEVHRDNVRIVFFLSAMLVFRMVAAVPVQVAAPQTTVVFQLSRVQNVAIHWRVLVCQVHHQRGLRHPSTNTVSNKLTCSKFKVKVIKHFSPVSMLLFCL